MSRLRSWKVDPARCCVLMVGGRWIIAVLPVCAVALWATGFGTGANVVTRRLMIPVTRPPVQMPWPGSIVFRTECNVDSFLFVIVHVASRTLVVIVNVNVHTVVITCPFLDGVAVSHMILVDLLRE